eukprot:CAMPEP_0194272620 /NCGR_PEP_ID=MMETSP0169-20130528/6137_1 /TAXON_ID=218684 /ORGANISM="Corethron pennatum, Strain L29A3" /LENGTH=479 /DNA_ID=CAMNT_0039015325 /DNA_START=68 /DNA_END=1507 /DNA_ORIENTATION=+
MTRRPNFLRIYAAAVLLHVASHTACAIHIRERAQGPLVSLRSGAAAGKPSPRKVTPTHDGGAPGAPPGPSSGASPPLPSPPRTLGVLQWSSFATVFAGALVAFSPAPAVSAALGPDRASSVLSALSSAAACAQILLSPVLGAAIDSSGRKSAAVCALAAAAVANGAVAARPSVVAICAAQCVVRLCVAFFFVVGQAVVGDVAASDPELMGSALGVWSALISAGFFAGSVAAGRLSEVGLSTKYGISATLLAANALYVSAALRETLPPDKRVPFEAGRAPGLLLRSPLACTRILYGRGREIRTLAIILMLMTLPKSMGEIFQIFAKTEWNLSTKDLISFVTAIMVIGTSANAVGSRLVAVLGIRNYTAAAALSCVLAPLGAVLFSFRGYLAGSAAGFLGSAQTLGVSAALIAAGGRSGVPQGELAGERSSLLALCGVVGPVWYGALYVQGKKMTGSAYLPFVFNALLAVGAFAMSCIHLS